MKLKAVYGTFNVDMQPIATVDITDVIINKYLHENQLIIPAKSDFNHLFTDPSPGKTKHIQLTEGSKKFNIMEDIYGSDIKINLLNPTPIIIVYYLYVNHNTNWRAIVSGQLLQLKSYGILDEAKLYIHISDNTGNFEQVIKLLLELTSNAIISTSIDNLFEYPGLTLTYNLAHQYPKGIIIYFHSKGMSHNIHTRLGDEVVLLTYTFKNWRRNIQEFDKEAISKLGLFPAIGDDRDNSKIGTRGGWIWFNFWYAKASYIINCEKPIISNNRHYYEHWLGLNNGNLVINNDCQSLYHDKIKKQFLFNRKNKIYFTPKQANETLDELINLDTFNRKLVLY